MKKNFQKTTSFFATLFIFCSLGNLAKSETLTNLGTLGGPNSVAYGVSSTGSVIVGSAYVDSSNTRAFSYTSAGGMISIGTLGGNNSYARGVSSNGSVIVGNADITGNSATHAFRYTSSTMTDLGVLAGGNNSFATGVSSDGTIVVGYSEAGSSSITKAFRYTSAGGMVNLGTLGSGVNSYANAISSDGTTIVGSSEFLSSSSADHAFKYVGSTMTDLGTLGGTNSYAFGVSTDGSVIVGESQITGDGAYHAFKYTNTGGMVSIGTLGGTNSYATAVSGDGAIVVGRSQISGNGAYHAFKYMGSTLTDLGTLGGANSYATAISNDGKVIVGYSEINGSADYHAFAASTVMIDLNNTYSALYANGNQLNSLINLKGNLVANELNKDCEVYGSSGVCFGISSGYSGIATPTPTARTFTSTATLGYNTTGVKSQAVGQGDVDIRLALRLNRYFRVGVFADQSFGATNPSNFSINNNMPMFGAFAALSEDINGRGASIRVSGAYSESEATITRRSKLAYTEAGQGKTKLKNGGLLAEISYGAPLSAQSIFQPFVGIRRTTATQNAYIEKDNISFPISYDEVSQKITTVFYGARIKGMVTRNFGMSLGGGVENDVQSKINGYSGTISGVGSFRLNAPEADKRRTFGDLGFFYNIDQAQRIGFNINYRQQPLSDAHAAAAYLNYSIGF